MNPTPEELAKAVDNVIAQADDDESAHFQEDQLLRQIIEAFCPEWVVAEVRRLADADFARWYA